MKNAIIGTALSFAGPLLAFVPYSLPGWPNFIESTAIGHSVAFFVFFASPVVAGASGYFFGREWKLDYALPACLIPPVVFFLVAEEATALQGGYQGTGGGAVFEFLLLPVFILFLSLILGLVGDSRRERAMKKDPTMVMT